MVEPKIIEIWENAAEFVIQEASSEVDGIHILAKVRGPAFFPDTTSRNNVYYSREAWEHAISDPDFRRRLADRLVFGTIGHSVELGDDDIRNDMHSHLVTNVWIDESGVGYAEYLILNTGPGRVLNTLLRVKSKIRVSTRAAGFFEKREGANGAKAVTPSSFKLERIDYVIDPGYTQALPQLIESLGSIDHNFIEENFMTEKVVQILEARVTELKAEKLITESAAATLQAEIRAITESNNKNLLVLENYKALGTTIALQESLSVLTQYSDIGTVQEIHEALEKSEDTITSLTDTIDDIKDQLGDETDVDEDDETDSDDETDAEYKELGSPSDVKDALTQALELTDELQRYRDLGSIEEIQQCMDSATQMTEQAEEQATQELVDTLGVSREVIDNLSEKGLSVEEISALVGSIKGTNSDAGDSELEVEEDDAGELVSDDVPPVEPPALDDEELDDEKVTVGESMSSQLLRRTKRKPLVISESKVKDAKSLSLAARLLTGRKQ